MIKGRVLVLSIDGSLGGTSRSALTAARAWATQGIAVDFFSPGQLHPARSGEFSSVGPIIPTVSDLALDDYDIVHFHHAGLVGRTREVFTEIVSHHTSGQNAPPLLSNNIFAVSDSLLDQWPAHRVTGVLGLWAAQQYKSATLCHRRRRIPIIIPNAQDSDFFRPPTLDERSAANERIGIDCQQVILRVGSPNRGKWSLDYLELAKSLVGSSSTLVLMGAPDSLLTALDGLEHVRLVPTTGSDVLLRDFYWAASAFMLSAQRGETFGNVLTEAMLCGVPTVYRNRPYRDNTPWEFQHIPLFSLAANRDDWIERGMHPQIGLSHDELLNAQFVSHHLISRDYGIPTVGARLVEVANLLLEGHDKSIPTILDRSPVAELPFKSRVHCFVGHNPIVSIAKQCRIALHSRTQLSSTS